MLNTIQEITQDEFLEIFPNIMPFNEQNNGQIIWYVENMPFLQCANNVVLHRIFIKIADKKIFQIYATQDGITGKLLSDNLIPKITKLLEESLQQRPCRDKTQRLQAHKMIQSEVKTMKEKNKEKICNLQYQKQF